MFPILSAIIYSLVTQRRRKALPQSSRVAQSRTETVRALLGVVLSLNKVGSALGSAAGKVPVERRRRRKGYWNGTSMFESGVNVTSSFYWHVFDAYSKKLWNNTALWLSLSSDRCGLIPSSIVWLSPFFQWDDLTEDCISENYMWVNSSHAPCHMLLFFLLLCPVQP